MPDGVGRAEATAELRGRQLEDAEGRGRGLLEPLDDGGQGLPKHRHQPSEPALGLLPRRGRPDILERCEELLLVHGRRDFAQRIAEIVDLAALVRGAREEAAQGGDSP